MNKAACKAGKWLARLVFAASAFAVFAFLNNTSMFSSLPQGRPKLLAHRGVAQTFPIKGLKWNTNTAAIIYKPEHEFIENTIPSVKAAFEAGADMVEFDVRLTSDDRLAVFHDYLLDYRTDATGMVASHTMDELRRLDVGYGYTADGGKTFPLRGKGAGLIVSAEELLAAFPGGSFLIHIKDGGAKLGKILADILARYDKEQIDRLGVYGDNEAITAVKQQIPGIRVLSMQTLKNSLIPYILFGWTGYIPESIRNSQVFIPLKYAKFLWGWPLKFQQRMMSVNTRLVIVNGDGKWSEGFDSEEDTTQIPAGFVGYVWTNRVDRLSANRKQINE